MDAVYPHHINDGTTNQKDKENVSPSEPAAVATKTSSAEEGTQSANAPTQQHQHNDAQPETPAAFTATSPQPLPMSMNAPPLATATATPPPPSKEDIIAEAMRFLSPTHIVSSRALLETGNPFVTTTKGPHDSTVMNNHHHRHPTAADLSAFYQEERAIAHDPLFTSPPLRRNGQLSEQEGQLQNVSNFTVAAFTNAAFPGLALLGFAQRDAIEQRQQAAYYADLLRSDSDKEDDEQGVRKKKIGSSSARSNNTMSKPKRMRHEFFDDKAHLRTAISAVIRGARYIEREKKLDEINSNLYRKSLADLDKKKEVIKTTLQKREEEEQKECTFKPVISQHAMQKKLQDEKPRGALEFFAGGNQWMKDKQKRLDKKIEKKNAEQAEKDEEDFKKWTLSKRNNQMLAKREKTIADAEAAGIVRKGTLAALKEWRKLNPASKRHFPSVKELENVLVDPSELADGHAEAEDAADEMQRWGLTAEEAAAHEEARRKTLRKTPEDLPDLDTVVAAEEKAFGNLYGYFDEQALAYVAELKFEKREEKRRIREEKIAAGRLNDDDDASDDDEDDDDDFYSLAADEFILQLIKADTTLDEKTRRLLLRRHQEKSKRRKVTALERYIRADREMPYWAEECYFHPETAPLSSHFAENKWRWASSNSGNYDIDDDGNPLIAYPNVRVRMEVDVRERLEKKREIEEQKRAEAEAERLRLLGKTGKGPQRTPQEAEAYARKLMTGRTTSDYLRAKEDEKAQQIREEWAADRANQHRNKVIKELLSTEAQLTFLLEAAEDPDCDLLELAKALPGTTSRKLGADSRRSKNETPSCARSAARGGALSPFSAGNRDYADPNDPSFAAQSKDMLVVDTLDDFTLLSNLTPRGIRIHSTPKNATVPVFIAAPPPTPDQIAPSASADASRLTANGAVAAKGATIHRSLAPTVTPLQSTVCDFRKENPKFLKAVEDMYGEASFQPQTERINAYNGTAIEGRNLVSAANYRGSKIAKGRQEIAEEIANDRLQLLRQKRLTAETQQTQIERLEMHKRRKEMAMERKIEEKLVQEREVCTFKPQVSKASAQLVAEKEARQAAEIEYLRQQLEAADMSATMNSSGVNNNNNPRTTDQKRTASARSSAETRRGAHHQHHQHQQQQQLAGGSSSTLDTTPSRIDNRNTMSLHRGFSPLRSAILRGGEDQQRQQRVSTPLKNTQQRTASSSPSRQRVGAADANNHNSSGIHGTPPIRRGSLVAGEINLTSTAAAGPSARWSSPAARERYEKERQKASRGMRTEMDAAASLTISRGGVREGSPSAHRQRLLLDASSDPNATPQFRSQALLRAQIANPDLDILRPSSTTSSSSAKASPSVADAAAKETVRALHQNDRLVKDLALGTTENGRLALDLNNNTNYAFQNTLNKFSERMLQKKTPIPSPTRKGEGSEALFAVANARIIRPIEGSLHPVDRRSVLLALQTADGNRNRACTNDDDQDEERFDVRHSSTATTATDYDLNVSRESGDRATNMNAPSTTKMNDYKSYYNNNKNSNNDRAAKVMRSPLRSSQKSPPRSPPRREMQQQQSSMTVINDDNTALNAKLARLQQQRAAMAENERRNSNSASNNDVPTPTRMSTATTSAASTSPSLSTSPSASSFNPLLATATRGKNTLAHANSRNATKNDSPQQHHNRRPPNHHHDEDDDVSSLSRDVSTDSLLVCQSLSLPPPPNNVKRVESNASAATTTANGTRTAEPKQYRHEEEPTATAPPPTKGKPLSKEHGRVRGADDFNLDLVDAFDMANHQHRRSNDHTNNRQTPTADTTVARKTSSSRAAAADGVKTAQHANTSNAKEGVGKKKQQDVERRLHNKNDIVAALQRLVEENEAGYNDDLIIGHGRQDEDDGEEEEVTSYDQQHQHRQGNAMPQSANINASADEEEDERAVLKRIQAMMAVKGQLSPPQSIAPTTLKNGRRVATQNDRKADNSSQTVAASRNSASVLPPPPLRISKSEEAFAKRIIASTYDDSNDDEGDKESYTAALLNDLRAWFLHLASLRMPSVRLGDANALRQLLSTAAHAEAGGDNDNETSSPSPTRARARERSLHQQKSSLDDNGLGEDGENEDGRATTATNSSSLTSPLQRLAAERDSETNHLLNGQSASFAKYIDAYGYNRGEEESLYYGSNARPATVALEVAHAALVVAMVEESNSALREEDGGLCADDEYETDARLVRSVKEAYTASSRSGGGGGGGAALHSDDNGLILVPLTEARVRFAKGIVSFDGFAELFVKMYGMV